MSYGIYVNAEEFANEELLGVARLTCPRNFRQSPAMLMTEGVQAQGKKVTLE